MGRCGPTRPPSVADAKQLALLVPDKRQIAAQGVAAAVVQLPAAQDGLDDVGRQGRQAVGLDSFSAMYPPGLAEIAFAMQSQNRVQREQSP